MKYEAYERLIWEHLKKVEPNRDYTYTSPVMKADAQSTEANVCFITEDAWDWELDDEVLNFITDHPHAKLEEICMFLVTIAPVMEIVDDDEIIDEEN